MSENWPHISEEQFNFLMEEPLNYFVLQQIAVGEIRSVQKLQDSICKGDQELSIWLQHTLKRMAKLGLLEICGDRIQIYDGGYQYKLTDKTRARLFPSLFETAARRALRNDSGNQHTVLFTISEDSETQNEVKTAIEAFRDHIRQIGARARNRKSNGVRMIGVVNSQMETSDFIPSVGPLDRTLDWTPGDLHKRITEMMKAAHDVRPAIAAIRTILSDSPNIEEATNGPLLLAALARIEKISLDFLPSQTFKFNPANLNTVVEKIVREKQNQFATESTLNLTLLKEDIRGAIDSFELERIIANLLQNSYEARNPEKESCISIAIRRFNDVAQIMVSDNGHGMSPSQVASIKSGSFKTSKMNGNGIGLNSVIQAVEATGGSVEIQSEEGKGTKVTLGLPLFELDLDSYL